MTTDEEWPEQVPQIIGAVKSILVVFLNPKEFAIGDLLPHNTFFAEIYFVNSLIPPMADPHVHQLGTIGRLKLHLRFDNSKYHTARHIQELMVSRQCVLIPLTWPSHTSICLASSSNDSREGPWTVTTTCPNRSLRLYK
jgi:hypothetical protein